MITFTRGGMRTLSAICLLALSACNASSSTTSDGSAPLPGNDSKSVGGGVGQRAYEIEGKAAADGTAIQLSKYKGKVVLLDFWATWCPPCVAAIPHEKQLFARFAGKPFALIGISIDRTEDDLTKFIGKNGLPWPNIFDENEKISQNWRIDAVPTFVLINALGEIVGRWEGSEDLPEIDIAIEREIGFVEKQK
jgi:thiol-disulfide isomerase/thioredoxin